MIDKLLRHFVSLLVCLHNWSCPLKWWFSVQNRTTRPRLEKINDLFQFIMKYETWLDRMQLIVFLSLPKKSYAQYDNIYQTCVQRKRALIARRTFTPSPGRRKQKKITSKHRLKTTIKTIKCVKPILAAIIYTYIYMYKSAEHIRFFSFG